MSERCEVCITYEGDAKENADFITFVYECRSIFRNIIWGPAAIKYGKDSVGLKLKYETIVEAEQGYHGGIGGYLGLNGQRWQTFIPIPWLWDRVYFRPHKFRQ